MSCLLRLSGVALVQHLPNDQFEHTMTKLTQLPSPVDDHGRSTDDTLPAIKASVACVCGGLVNTPRKFVNQEHYNTWMRRRQYWWKDRIK